MSAGTVLVPTRGMVMVASLPPPHDEPAVPSQATAIEEGVADPDGSALGVAGEMVMSPVSPPLAWAAVATMSGRNPSDRATARTAPRWRRADRPRCDIL